MELGKLHNQIMNGDLEHFYIFTGEEIEVQRIYIENIVKRTTTAIERVDSIDSILDSLKRKSLLNRNRCVVVRDDKSFMQDEKLQDIIESFLGDNILVLLFTNLDKRTKFYKKYKDRIVEFEPLSEHLLIKYIQKETNISTKNCQKLIEICESNYGRILLEINKIKNYLDAIDITGDNLTWDYGFEQLLKDGTIHQPPKDAVFDFVDAVLRRQPERAFDLLRQSYEVGEATLVLLSVLYTNIKQVLQVQSCGNNIEKSTGLTAWQVKCAKEKAGKYRVGELVEALYLLQSVEKALKQGTMDDGIAMEYILVKIL